ncbi:MAG: PAS domain S-box protein, partial [Methanospirillum sp.]|uniref:PAS domain-containing protein n=1 Tax=Methanospirillum sp. TaxID=45200 RepID=UPI002374348E
VYDVIWTADGDMNLTYISPSVRGLLGYTPEEIIRMPKNDIYPPGYRKKIVDGRKKTIEALRNNCEPPVISEIEIELLRKDGSKVWTGGIITPVIDSQKHCVGVVGIIRDISIRKQAEDALRQSEETFRSFVENANDIIYSLTIEGIFTYVSPKWTDVLGYEISETLGKPYDLFIDPDDLPVCHEFVREVFITGEKMSGIEYRIRHKNGTWQWHTTTASPIRNTEGKITHYLGICRDITERRKSEEALKNANRQLNLLTSITRHDILNKISVILGYLAVIEVESGDNAISDYYKKIQRATKEIQSQIEFTRVYEELGSHEPKWMQLDSMISDLSLPDSVALKTDIQNISIFADPMLDKVFFNLLDNSIRHGQRMTEIQVTSYESGSDMIVVWEDNGVGIAEEEKEKIFERGFGKNTGLGMFLVREILSLTDITIQETGTQGTGARFEIMVPKGGWQRKISVRE